MVISAQGIFSGLYDRLPEHIKQTKAIAIQRTLSDPDISEFLDRYNLRNDQEFIDSNMAQFMNYIKIRDKDKHYTADLNYRNHAVSVDYRLRSKVLEDRYIRGWSLVAKATYDKTTKVFAGKRVEDTETMYNAHARHYLSSYVEGYAPGRVGKGMWLVGEMGIGKTHLMADFTSRLVDKGNNVMFISLRQLVHDVQESMKYSGSNINARVRQVQEAEILILDDVGTEAIGNWFLKSIIYPIFDYRMNNNLPTFVTSNLTIDQYVDQVKRGKEVIALDAARLQERLITLMKQVSMGGPNRRHG